MTFEEAATITQDASDELRKSLMNNLTDQILESNSVRQLVTIFMQDYYDEPSMQKLMLSLTMAVHFGVMIGRVMYDNNATINN
jgi:hypothetical protein